MINNQVLFIKKEPIAIYWFWFFSLSASPHKGRYLTIAFHEKSVTDNIIQSGNTQPTIPGPGEYCAGRYPPDPDTTP